MQKKYGVINQLRKTRMLELFRTYLVVGSMPRAVERYKETNNFSIVHNIQIHCGSSVYLYRYHKRVAVSSRGLCAKVSSFFRRDTI